MKWMTAAEFAEALGKSVRVVNRMCRDGQLRCRKFGRTWYVHESELG